VARPESSSVWRRHAFRDVASTDLPIAELAPMVGFRAQENLRRSFRKAYGMSPREYRAQGRGAHPAPASPEL